MVDLSSSHKVYTSGSQTFSTHGSLYSLATSLVSPVRYFGWVGEGRGKLGLSMKNERILQHPGQVCLPHGVLCYRVWKPLIYTDHLRKVRQQCSNQEYSICDISADRKSAFNLAEECCLRGGSSCSRQLNEWPGPLGQDSKIKLLIT